MKRAKHVTVLKDAAEESKEVAESKQVHILLMLSLLLLDGCCCVAHPKRAAACDTFCPAASPAALPRRCSQLNIRPHCCGFQVDVDTGHLAEKILASGELSWNPMLEDSVDYCEQPTPPNSPPLVPSPRFISCLRPSFSSSWCVLYVSV